ncbi:hypothetical protein ACIQAC_01455 [Streptomyces sp. NPDC088387]|uniref:hypothetical protein n=1 Tax=Streptomyces sp. NPDC088387 TaxID=3365859 RepID=UPI003816A99D
MTISPLALAAKKVIEAAWLHGDAYDLASQAAFALESAQLLQSPETAAELDQLRERVAAAPAELAIDERSALARQLGDTSPATTGLIVSLVKAIRNVREHDHPTWEDLYCFNLLSFMGERMGPVLRRLLNAEARVAELEQLLAAKDRTVDEDPIAFALTEKAAETVPAPEPDVSRPVLKLRTLLAGQRAALEDPHDNPLHHDYRVGRDLPEVRQ